MVSQRMLQLGTARSVIRELFEYGRQRAAEVGAENVFDFSLGNPSVPAPAAVNETAIRLLREQGDTIHCYTSAPGDTGARQRIADSLNRRFGEHLGVTKPSVTYATKRLRENGYIEMDKDGLITLTDSGMEIAAKMLQRHHTLTNFLVELGVDPVTAEEDACKMEHDISDQTFRAICDLARHHLENG